MRLRKALLLLAVVVGSLTLAGCANLPGGQPTTDTQTTPPSATSPTSGTSTSENPSTSTATQTTSPTTTTRVDYTRPTKHDLRIVNDLDTEAVVKLTIQNQSNETILEQEFTLAANSNITQNLSYSGPRGAVYNISATQNGSTATTSAQEPWNKLIYISVNSEGIRISIMAV